MNPHGDTRLAPVAILHPSGLRRARWRRLLGQREVPCVSFSRPAELEVALAQGRLFSLLVLAFGGPVLTARKSLEQILGQAGPAMPVQLFMTHDQVDLAGCVMSRQQVDYVLEACSQPEEDCHLLVLLARHSGHAVSPDWFAGLFGEGGARAPVARDADESDLLRGRPLSRHARS